MQPVQVTISEDGSIRFLVNDDIQPFANALDGDAVSRRASHVEPVSRVLRTVFHGLRGIFGEKGWMADFTRRWGCLWRINLAPIDGPILPTYYRDRAQAINAEIGWLNEHFI